MMDFSVDCDSSRLSAIIYQIGLTFRIAAPIVRTLCAPVVPADRVPGYEPGGRFESRARY